MARIFFLAFERANQYVLVKKLRNLGHKLIVTEPKYPDFANLLKQQIQPPEVVLCDCSMLPSQTRETCNYLRTLKAHKETPFILYNVRPEDEAKTREKVPGAIVLANDDVLPALDAALSRLPAGSTTKPT